MKKKMIKVLNILLFIGLVFNGCVNLKNDSENDKSELMRLLDEDTAVGIDGYDDEGIVVWSLIMVLNLLVCKE